MTKGHILTFGKVRYLCLPRHAGSALPTTGPLDTEVPSLEIKQAGRSLRVLSVYCSRKECTEISASPFVFILQEIYKIHGKTYICVFILDNIRSKNVGRLIIWGFEKNTFFISGISTWLICSG